MKMHRTPTRRRALLLAAVLMGAALALPAGTARARVTERNDAAPVSASLQPTLRPIYSARTEDKVVALTFDISWGNQMAPKVLEVLRNEKVPATFFLSGPWAKNHAELVKQIQADGHEIESHGHAHVDLNTLGREGAARNIAAAHAILKELTGRDPTYIRPPNGAFNEASVQAAKDLGYATVIWSVDSLDWKNPGVDRIVNRTVRLAHPGAIILMHASDSCKQTDQALPAIIRSLREQGYRFLLLDDLIRTYGVDMNGHIRVLR
ncbi:MAG: polysaccharide deacetylase family sporulation protein PdaB [Symbiobacterium thermophilum]|uniref:Polysaccharide deacetylase n=3 Tax=Symbiobacterium thermophilum TaxID=2734 RepID=Q67QP5_SYMTH|nr:MAG: polysaccharide deacetylase family sporulation protein PdaB [Symbiobacterium thermophilum]BAD39998.1 polysaccharide deacetylase [Symbiobacterium thermophilum IAM 14863]